MARVTITLKLDGGAEMTVVERSVVPATGGMPAAALVQGAYMKILGGLGLTSTTTTGNEPDPAGADTTEAEKA